MNYKLILAYDGTRYQGFASQPGTDRTIQGKIEAVLMRLLEEEASAGTRRTEAAVHPARTEEDAGGSTSVPRVKLIGAGRTDAGVHARAMCANVHLDTGYDAEELKDLLNRYLPEDIAVTDCRVASDRFHARYNAVEKTYRYTCYVGEAKPVFDRRYVTVLETAPDLARMREAAAYLTGTHDFRSFCLHPGKDKSTVRTVRAIDIKRKGDLLYLTFSGDGFLRAMVRILTGTLLEVGYGRIPVEEIPAIRDAKDRAASGPAAPPEGLTLLEVRY